MAELKMPTALTIEGFRFFFYSNEHDPIHVHVEYGGGEAVFTVSADGVSLRKSDGMRIPDLNRAAELAREHRSTIEEKWHEHFKRR